MTPSRLIAGVPRISARLKSRPSFIWGKCSAGHGEERYPLLGAGLLCCFGIRPCLERIVRRRRGECTLGWICTGELSPCARLGVIQRSSKVPAPDSMGRGCASRHAVVPRKQPNTRSNVISCINTFLSCDVLACVPQRNAPRFSKAWCTQGPRPHTQLSPTMALSTSATLSPRYLAWIAESSTKSTTLEG